MGSAPAIRDFSSWLDLQSSKVIVIGAVETPASNQRPELNVSEATDVSGAILKLELSIRKTGGIGTQAIQFHPARFERPTDQNLYAMVQIRWQGQVLTEVDIDQ